jgi:hypothetical protein
MFAILQLVVTVAANQFESRHRLEVENLSLLKKVFSDRLQMIRLDSWAGLYIAEVRDTAA